MFACLSTLIIYKAHVTVTAIGILLWTCPYLVWPAAVDFVGLMFMLLILPVHVAMWKCSIKLVSGVSRDTRYSAAIDSQSVSPPHPPGGRRAFGFCSVSGRLLQPLWQHHLHWHDQPFCLAQGDAVGCGQTIVSVIATGRMVTLLLIPIMILSTTSKPVILLPVCL